MNSLIPLLLAVALFGGAAARAAEKPINATRAGLAVEGHDVVAYFTEGGTVKGSAEFTHEWRGAKWRFASAAHRDRFAAAPENHAPQFGGYCAWAVSQGYTARIDPAAWKIVDGKLYLNYSLKVKATWEKDIPGNIRKAEANWPGVLEK